MIAKCNKNRLNINGELQGRGRGRGGGWLGLLKILLVIFHSELVILRRLVGESSDEGEHGADAVRIDGGGDGDDDIGDDDKMDGGDEERSQLSLNFLLLIPLPPLSPSPTLNSLVM